MAFRWDLNEHVPEGVIRLVSEEVDYAIVQLGNEANDRDEAVHEARKSLKKIRAIMRLIRYEIGEDTYQQQNAFYRDLGRMLAPLRDAFVVTQTMEDVAETLTDKSDQDIAQAIRADLETTYQLTRSAFWESGEAVAQVLQQLEEERPHIQNLPIRHDNFKAFQKGLGRFFQLP